MDVPAPNPNVGKTTEITTSFWLPVWTLFQRELVRFYRQRSRVLGALGTPLVFWFLVGSGICKSFRPQSGLAPSGYLEYFFPGTLLLILLFTSIFSTISVIEDRREGFLLSVLVAPISRASLVLGKILGGTALALFQGLLFLLLAPAVGIRLRPVPLLFLSGVLFLVAFALTALGFYLAWRLDSVQGFHAVANLLLIPMWALSGALFPPSGASRWIRWVMQVNPLTYNLGAVRWMLYHGTPLAGADVPPLGLSVGVTMAFGLLALLASFAQVARPQSRAAR